MNDDIFESYKPELSERFKTNAHRIFELIKEDLGPELKGVYNSWTWVKSFNAAVRPFYNGTALDEAKLEAAATKYADDVVESWKTKIDQKVGMLDEGHVVHLDGCRFSIVGKKAGNTVVITQDMIVNVSSKGTLFNQFPARIHMNGKSISAANFKKAFV